MNKPKHSIRYSISLVVFLLGLSGLLLSVITGYIYQNLILENQKNSFISLSGREVDLLQNRIIARASNLGLTTQSDPEFRSAMTRQDDVRISALLDEQFRRFYVTTTLLDLRSIQLVDIDFNILGYSDNESALYGKESMACPNLIASAKRRHGPERIKIISELCVFHGDPVISVLVPVGGLRLSGYLIIVVDPTQDFADIEVGVGMPVKLHKIDSSEVYQSVDWSEGSDGEHIVWRYILKSTLGVPVYEFEFLYDISILRSQIKRTRLFLLSIAISVTLLFIILSLYILRKTTLLPLKVLKNHLHKVMSDKEHLNELVVVDGNIEMYELAKGFNDMSTELARLYGKLEEDISELELKEVELSKHRNYLEELVEQRTIDLVAAREEAERASAAKSEFLSQMSHELRTPLNAILGFGQILAMNKDNLLTEDDKDSVQEILVAGNHLLELVNDILDLSRIEAGHLDISLEIISLNELIFSCITMTQPLADKSGIHLNDHISTDPAHNIYVDCRRFKQVVLNLLSNAVKYNRENGEVILSCKVLSNGYVRLLIEDTGLGIDDKHKEKIFEPFERLAARKIIIGGTGIGLVITKRLIEAMGGKVGFESILGQGSCFWVDVPLATEV